MRPNGSNIFINGALVGTCVAVVDICRWSTTRMEIHYGPDKRDGHIIRRPVRPGHVTIAPPKLIYPSDGALRAFRDWLEPIITSSQPRDDDGDPEDLREVRIEGLQNGKRETYTYSLAYPHMVDLRQTATVGVALTVLSVPTHAELPVDEVATQEAEDVLAVGRLITSQFLQAAADNVGDLVRDHLGGW